MKIDKGMKETANKICIYGAALSIFLAGVGAVGHDIWLASTQWLLVGAVLVLFAIYLKIS